MHLRTSLVVLLACVICSAAWTAEHDPFIAIDPTADLALLEGLARELDHAPASDPRLGIAEMALVDLALSGDPRDRGGRGGIWRQRAHEVRDLRTAAGVHPTGLNEALPSLWVDALDGKATECLAALDRYPEATHHPQGRALRCYVTGDWRELRALTDVTPHEQFALAFAYAKCGMGQALSEMDHRGIPPFVYGTLLVWVLGFTHEGTETCVRSAVDQAAQLIGISDSPEVRPCEVALATALSVPEPSVANVRRAIARGDAVDHGETILAAWNLAEALAAAPGGLRTADGAWNFVGPHERGSAARLSLLLGSWHRHNFLRLMLAVPESADRLSKPLAGDQSVLGGFHRLLANGFKTPADGDVLLAAISQEMSRGDGAIPPMRLIGMADLLRERQQQQGAPASRLMTNLAGLHAGAEHGSAGWTEVVTDMAKIDGLAGLREGIIEAAAGDPFSVEIVEAAATLSRGSIPEWTGEPHARWIDPNVDRSDAQFPQAGRSDRIGVRWQGKLLIRAAGAYRFATESDDGSQLSIDGGLVVENGGDHATKRMEGVVTLTAGQHVIDLRWFNTLGGASCRLLWQLPGSSEVVPIPTTVLSTPSGEPGLAAAVWLLDATPAESTDSDALARMPWRLDLVAKRFDMLYDQQRWSDCLQVAETLLAQEPGSGRVGRRYGWCLKQLGRIDDAISAWKAYITASHEFDTIFARGDIASALDARHDFVEAERYYLEAANSWQANAMLSYGEFLGRRGRGREGLVWIDRTIERYGQDMYHLTAAKVLLLKPVPPQADLDEAMRRIETHRDLLARYRDAWQLCGCIEMCGLHDRFLALIDERWHAAHNGLAVKMGCLLMASGHPAEAIDWFAQELAKPDSLKDEAVGYVQAMQTLAARLAKRPDLAIAPDRLRTRIGHGRFVDPIDPLLRYLVGDASREAALTEAGKDADELTYYLGIDALAHGDLAQARIDLQLVIAGHPDWIETGDARRLLVWMDAGVPVTTDPVQREATPAGAKPGDF